MKIEQELADLRAGRYVAPAAPEPERRRANDVEPLDQDHTISEHKRDETLLGDAHGQAREGDNFSRYLNGPLKDAVAKICADLGLAPDWSQWVEDDGFPPPPGGDIGAWGIFLAPEIDTPQPGPEGQEPLAPRPRGRRKKPWRLSWPPPGGVGPPPSYATTASPRFRATSHSTQRAGALAFEGVSA